MKINFSPPREEGLGEVISKNNPLSISPSRPPQNRVLFWGTPVRGGEASLYDR